MLQRDRRRMALALIPPSLQVDMSRESGIDMGKTWISSFSLSVISG